MTVGDTKPHISEEPSCVRSHIEEPCSGIKRRRPVGSLCPTPLRKIACQLAKEVDAERFLSLKTWLMQAKAQLSIEQYDGFRRCLSTLAQAKERAEDSALKDVESDVSRSLQDLASLLSEAVAANSITDEFATSFEIALPAVQWVRQSWRAQLLACVQAKTAGGVSCDGSFPLNVEQEAVKAWQPDAERTTPVGQPEAIVAGDVVSQQHTAVDDTTAQLPATEPSQAIVAGDVVSQQHTAEDDTTVELPATEPSQAIFAGNVVSQQHTAVDDTTVELAAAEPAQVDGNGEVCSKPADAEDPAAVALEAPGDVAEPGPAEPPAPSKPAKAPVIVYELRGGQLVIVEKRYDD